MNETSIMRRKSFKTLTIIIRIIPVVVILPLHRTQWNFFEKTA